ncbi:GNAT family N-acetyltransferase [Leptospirillum ferriphilum]|jgi:GNAT superfamily N-acetyltransferase|uniref:Probable N-acetyltransferase family protein n=1 Tax=Leptospirillum sp. Group II '5-way CG' TaxID=419541 RepID=B6ARI3_9BACT|nr:MAG: Probable N-acetyltransferase family protein [Leptospirillum sp. Group II '5-way CG']
MVQFVLAQPSMAPILARMWKSLLEEESPPLVEAGKSGEASCAETVRRMLEDPQRCAGFVAVDAGEVVGFILGYTYKRPYGEPSDVGQILHWYVEPSHRGAGIGEGLYDRLWNWFSSRNVGIVEVMACDGPVREKAWTSRGFVPALRVYATRMGPPKEKTGKIQEKKP